MKWTSNRQLDSYINFLNKAILYTNRLKNEYIAIINKVIK